MKPRYKIMLFGVSAPLLIVISFLLLSQVSPMKGSDFPSQILGVTTEIQNPLLLPQFVGSFNTTDARVHIIKEYLKRYSSPLLTYAQDIVEISDKYSLDYRLLIAIARQESNLCKRIPPDSHNCWGFGIYGDKVTRFDNYPQAMEIVAQTLKNKYIDMGFDTPEKIMAKYTPPSLEKGGPWAKGVSQFMTDLE